MKTKRWLAKIFSLVCIAGSVFGFSSCTTTKTDGMLVYKIAQDNTYANVKKYKGTPTDIIIPTEYEGIPITCIDDYAFWFCDSLTSVVIPDSVTTIEKYAFGWCTNLKNATLGNGITAIKNDAFNNCKKLESINIPDSVTTIGSYAFANCNKLQEMSIPNGVTTIGEYAFSYCGELKKIVIPNSVTFIDYKAFVNCGNLTIYCEAESQPDGWYAHWNFSNCPVVWGYTGE